MKESKILEAMERINQRLELRNAELEQNGKGLFYDENTFSNQKQASFEENVRLTEISSSLMIPEELLAILKIKLKKYKGFKLYLHHLIEKYEIHILNGIIPKYGRVTTKYQKKDQSLQKIGIRPWSSDWGMLQLLRCSHGLSMSAIFVYLLKADSVEFAKTLSEYLVRAGIPTTLHLTISGEIFLEDKKFRFGRIFQYH